MSEPFFPPPQKKESAPYRAAAEIPIATAIAKPAYPELREKPQEPAPRPAMSAQEADLEPEEPLLVRFVWRLAARLVGLAATIGVLWALVRMHELGAKWPQAVLVVLGIVGIVAAPVVLYFRLRRLVRFLFARNDDG